MTKGKLSTDSCIKPTDCHQYLHYCSGHPEHTKRSIVYSQLLRVSWICSRENDFNRHKSNMKIWFQKRRYLENIIENEMKKVKFPSCNKAQRKNSKGIAFVVTYHPLLKQFEGILRRNLYLLNMNAEVKQTFTPVPMVSDRSSRKLSSYLVRAKLYPTVRIVRSKGCGKSDVKYVLTYVKQILLLAQSLEKHLKSIISLIATISAEFIFLRASAVAKNILEKPLESSGLGGTTIDIMTGNILGMRIVFRNIYLDIFIVGNIQVSLKMSR